MASCLKKFSTLIIYCQATSWSMSSVLPSLICMASRRKHAQPGFLLQACTAWFPAADCKHVQFPAAKGTGYHASSHIITSYVLKRNRKQANKKESRALFWVWAGRAGWKMTFFFSMYLWQDILADQDQSPRWKSSLTDFSSKSGCISPLKIIPLGHFQQIRMHFHTGNHPTGNHPDENHISPLKKACPAYETGRMHSERNSMRNHRKNEWKSKKWLNITGNK